MKAIDILGKISFFVLFVFSVSVFAGGKGHKHHHHDHSHKKGSLKAHTHGEAEMKLVQEGKKVLVTVEFSGEDVFGFEKVAETDAEKKTVQKIRDYFEQYDDVVEFADGDSCDPKKYRTRLEAQETKGAKKNTSTHSEFHVEYTFECSSSPSSVKFLSFSRFPSVEKIKVSYLLGKKNGRGKITPKKPMISFK